MTIKLITFVHPVFLGKHANAGAEQWLPQRYPAVAAAKKDGGIVLSWEEGGEQFACHVPMTNIKQVLYVEAPAKKAGV